MKTGASKQSLFALFQNLLGERCQIQEWQKQIITDEMLTIVAPRRGKTKFKRLIGWPRCAGKTAIGRARSTVVFPVACSQCGHRQTFDSDVQGSDICAKCGGRCGVRMKVTV